MDLSLRESAIMETFILNVGSYSETVTTVFAPVRF